MNLLFLFSFLSLPLKSLCEYYLVKTNNLLYYSTFINNEYDNIINTYSFESYSIFLTSYDSFPHHLYNYVFISLIEKDEIISIQSSEEIQYNPVWNLDRIDQRNLPLDKMYHYSHSGGKNVINYIVDSGIDINHKDFTGRAQYGIDLINEKCLHPHGTHVAGIVGSSTYGVAKNTTLVSVRVLDCKGSGQYSSLISSLEWIIKQFKTHNKKSIVNLSLGGPNNEILKDVLKTMVNLGIHVVVAGGNEHNNACNSSPANEKSVITVGATNKNDEIAWFSNYGKCIDILAPGVSIMSTVLNNNIMSMDGTSMAAPHVSGVLSLYLDYNNDKPLELKEKLIYMSSKNKIKGQLLNTPNNFLYSLLL